MHLLIVFTGELKTSHYPLGGKFQIDHAIALKKLGYKIGIIAPGLLSVRRLFKKYPFKKNETIEGIPVLRDFKKNLLPARINYYNYFLSKEYRKFGLKIFEEYIKKNGIPDLIHAHDVRFGIYVADEIYKKYKIPFLTTECSSETAENLFPSILKKSSYKILKKSKFISAVSKPFAKVFEKKLGFRKNTVKPFYPVMPMDFNKEKFYKKKSDKKFTFITINRLDKNKNIELIIKSFANNFKNRSAVLKIIGDGNYYKRLKKLVNSLNLNHKIFFINKASRINMKKHLKKSDCLLSSSFHETFGVVLIEALSYGIPVISTMSEGPSEIINSKNGILVKKRSYINYSNAMLKMYDKKIKFNSLKIKKDILNKFGVKTFCKNANKIYKQCLKKNYPN